MTSSTTSGRVASTPSSQPPDALRRGGPTQGLGARSLRPLSVPWVASVAGSSRTHLGLAHSDSPGGGGLGLARQLPLPGGPALGDLVLPLRAAGVFVRPFLALRRLRVVRPLVTVGLISASGAARPSRGPLECAAVPPFRSRSATSAARRRPRPPVRRRRPSPTVGVCLRASTCSAHLDGGKNPPFAPDTFPIS